MSPVRRRGVKLGPVVRIQCHCGRNLAETADPLAYDVSPRPGITGRQRKHDAGAFDVTFTWDCPQCQATPSLRAVTIAAAARAVAEGLPPGPRVVVLRIGRDL